MKILILLISLFLLVKISLNAQTISFQNNPTFDSIIVIPENPTLNDSISIVIFISNENDTRQFMGIDKEIINDTIKIYASCFEISLTPTTEFIDTVNLGKLQPKIYNIILLNRRIVIIGGEENDEISYIDTAKYALEVRSSTSIKYASNINLNIFPVPTYIYLNIESSNQISEIYKISIFNLQGKRLLEFKETTQINISRLKKGIYILRIQMKNGEITDHKIIKN